MENEATNTETTALGTEEQTQEAKTYTEDEVQAMLQRETDKRVSEAMKKAERKTQAKIKEAEKLAQMNEEQKYQYELEQREKKIEAKERELALAENKASASAILADRGISTKLVDMVVAEDADEMMNNINTLDEAFKASVKAEVEKRLASSTPKKNLPLNQSLTQESFRKMPLSQQAEIAKNNPDLYKQFTGR